MVVDAAGRLLQVEVEEGQLDDEPGRRSHCPLAVLRVWIPLWVAGRRELALGIR